MKLISSITLFLTCQIIIGQAAGCLAPINEQSSMLSNPTKVNGKFSFDYKIMSQITGYWQDDVSSPGINNHHLLLHYYINTADGSLFMSEGYVNILLLSAGSEFRQIIHNPMGKIEGLIRMANGQLVLYVLDRKNGKKRAITLENNMQLFNLVDDQKSKLRSYINEAIQSGNIGKATGSASKASELIMRKNLWGSNGGLTQINGPWEQGRGKIQYKVTMQIANRPGIKPIATNIPMVGLLAGIMKTKRSPCNYLVVETTIDQTEKDMVVGDPAYDEPPWIPTEFTDATVTETMTSITNTPKSFDTSGYEIMRLQGGFNLSEIQRDKILDSQGEYYAKLGRLLKQLERCGDDEFCIARVNQDILVLQKKFDNQAYHAANTGDISDEQLEEQVVKDRMYTVHGQIIEQEKKCKSLNDQTARCGGCMDGPYDDCLKRLEEMYDFLNELECRLAKIKGMQDLMDNCH